MAAINACGINQEIALKHLNLALQLEPAGILKTVEDAVKFCKFELNEVKEWRNILTKQSEKKEDSLETVKSSNKITKKNHNPQEKNIIIEMLLPVRIIKNIIFIGMKNVFFYTGICDENIMKKNEKDFSGFGGYVSQIIKKTCTYEPENRSTNYSNTEKEKEKEKEKKEEAEKEKTNVANEGKIEDVSIQAQTDMMKVR